MDTFIDQSTWERISYQKELDEYIKKHSCLTQQEYKDMILGSFESNGLTSKHKELIHFLSLSFFNSIKNNRDQNIFSIVVDVKDGLEFEEKDLEYIEKVMRVNLGYKFEVLFYDTKNKILVKTNTLWE